ncbi:non-ribosomal peptide synthetase [Nodularia sp. NIES-3585]|uniref:non-ribosomal peptide synthetase n=1 Tax=Nodularia sp. NIES-3585 TaxID=1973477 RepID=UPI000B5CADF9|nr:non-ribosomal peptide synthetase [Nodularia sp. NIES-3585]GAX38390.1 amino acid adenylation domain protein [Nodularia sp. NIES-3585]
MINITAKGFRLSPHQKHLWLLQQNSSAYLTQGAIRIEGNFQADIFKKALQTVVNRHEILRTSFCQLPSRKYPVMVVSDSSVTLPVWQDIDLSFCSEQEYFWKIAELFQQDRHIGFDLEQGLIFRLYLLKCSPSLHTLLISLPALVADVQTIKNLVREISSSYFNCLENQELNEQPVQFIQFSEWHNQLLVDEDAEKAKNYWDEQKASPLARLPFENKLLNQSKFAVDCYQFQSDFELTEKMAILAQKYDTSTAVILLVCWQTLIWRLTGESDIIIGMGCNLRQYEELDEVLGLLATWIPIKSYLTPDLNLGELLESVKKTLDDTTEWQDYFVPESLENDNDLAFPIGFEFEQLTEKLFAKDVSFSLQKYYSCIEPFKLKLSCTQDESSLIADFYYDNNYFSQDTIERLAGQFQTLLTSVTTNPAQKISQLEIISPSDRQQLLNFNQAQIDYPTDQCIHQLFAEQVEKTPHQVAVVFEDQQLTYAQLNHKANQLAHYLQKLGVKPEVVVGLCLERSLEMIVGLLGIIKAGGAYLPLDPNLPTSGITWRSQDAEVPILLTQHQLVDRFSECTAKIISLDSDWEIINQEPSGNLTSQVRPDNSVYVIYTSGSTGVPKGVVVEHQQLLNYLYNIQEILNLPADASFATVSTFAADLGNTVIFPSLCRGGCLHLISSDRASDPQALADYFYHHPIDCLKIVPSHLKALLTSQTNKAILPRQRLVLGGEATSWNLIEQIRQLAPDCQIINHYGPTETTVGVTTFTVSQEATSQEYQTVPIGRPLANTQIYLLDSVGQLVPMGVPGELHIGGAALARGYLKQPDLTAEKFINHPFIPGKKLYKTGDLVRYLSDGNIEFLGRIDHQIKVRGFRIELGEIETSLLKHPAVSETVVTAQEDETGNKRLVAYVVPKHELDPKTTELRQFLLELLPEYMVPAFFVQLKALPLTANGKVNRQLLPAPDTSRTVLKETYIAPRTPNEKILAKIWAQVLRVEQVGIGDNFFELGGDSIISIQIVARANQAGLKLKPKQLFEHQTIGELAAAAGTNFVIMAEQETITGSLPLTPIQHWFFEQNQPEPHHWNQTVLLQVRRSLDHVCLEKTVQQLLLYHDALRLRFIQTESGWQQINADFENVMPFTHIDLSALPETEQQQALETAAAELQTSFDLSSNPLVRVALFNLGASKPSRLLILIHHLAVDGVSWRILLEDFQTIYEQLERGEVTELPPKTTSFKRWAELLTDYANSAEVRQEWDYWLTQTQKSFSSFPVDYLEGNNTLASEKIVSVSLSKAETQALLQEVPSAYSTQINEVLLTALVQAFAELTGENSLLVEMEGHGREEICDNVDLSRTVGWFTTHFPVLLDLGKNLDPGTALKLIKEQLRNIPHRGIGYGLLRYLKEDRNITDQLAKLPEPPVKFNYLGQFDKIMSESSLFEPADESTGPERSLQGSRDRLLVVNSLISSGQLQLSWSYSENIHRRTTIETLAENFVQALRELITHCQSPEAGGYTPSDFSKANVSQKDLDQLLAKINQGNK